MILKKWNDLYISGALARCNPFVLQGVGGAGLRGPKVGAGAAGGHSRQQLSVSTGPGGQHQYVLTDRQP